MKQAGKCILLMLILFSCSSEKKKTGSPLYDNFRKPGPGISQSKQDRPANIVHQGSMWQRQDKGSEGRNEYIGRTLNRGAAYGAKNSSGYKGRNGAYQGQQVRDIPPARSPGTQDSVRLSNIEWLRISGFPLDFSEPLNRDILREVSADSLFQSSIQLSPDRVLRISFDNDIFDYTDQFYTNGIRFDYVAPALADNPVKYMLLPYWSAAKNYYGLSVLQNLYTPSTTKIGGILYGDRPYSAYLLLKSFKISNDQVHHFRQTSALDFGVIGSASMGGAVQDWFHKSVPANSEPLGWQYQIKNDVIINYNCNLEKGILNYPNAEMIICANASAGTLYTNLGGGLNLRLGWFNPYFSDLGIEKRKSLWAKGLRKTQVYFTLKGTARLIAYDATLEGGVFNRTSPYTIPSTDVARIVTQSSVSFNMTWGGIGIELEQCVLSPEFSHRWWHAWGHIGLLFAF
jgi:hypothetical protein